MYEDTPQDLVHDLLGEAVFGAHALGRRVIGSAEVISSVTRRALRGYHRRLLRRRQHRRRGRRQRRPRRPRRAASAAADSRARPPRRCPRRARRRARPTPPTPGLRFQRKDTEQYHVCLGAPGVSRSDPRRFAASVLDAILGGSASSRLFQEIREKRGLAYSVYSFASQYADTGQVGIYVGTREENLARGARDRLRPGGRHRRRRARPSASCAGRRRTSRAACCSRWSRPRPACSGSASRSSPPPRSCASSACIAEHRRASRPARVCALAAELLAPERLSAAAIGPAREAPAGRARPASAPSLARRRLRPGAGGAGAAERRERQGRRACSPPPCCAAGHELVERRVRRPRRWSTSPRPDAVLANVLRALAAGVPCRGGDERLGRPTRSTRPHERRAAGLLRPQLRARRGADDALRRRGVAATSRRWRSSSSTTPSKLDAPSGTARATAAAARRGGADPLRAPARPRRPPGGHLRRARRDADDPPRRRSRARPTFPASLLALGRLRELPAGLTVGLEQLL